jgi:hypothetical protein
VKDCRAGHADRRLEPGAGVGPEIRHRFDEGAPGARPRQSRQAQLRLQRPGQSAATDDGDAQARRRASTSSRCLSAATARSTPR